jgi:hypothetical protein
MKVQVEVPEQFIKDTLVSGFEGGSGYWLQIRNDLKPMGKDYIETLFDTGLMVQDQLNEESGAIMLTKKMIEEGVSKMAIHQPRHFQDMVNENGDAETGDVLLQFVVNGALLYG